MIQRIQTVYLLFVFCLTVTILFVPFSSTTIAFNAGFYKGYFSVVALLTIFTVFLYKNRKLQIKLCYAILLSLILIYAFYFIFDRQNLPFADFFRYVRFTFIFPFIAAVFSYLAIRGIKKDEKLVRSLDRLR